MPNRKHQTESRRETAEDLRRRAQAIRDKITAEKQALADEAQAIAERREAEAAGKLDEQARELDLEQDRVDRAAELRSHADAEEASAGDLDARVSQINIEMFEVVIRAVRFEQQIAGEVTERRQDLERQGSEAAQTGDAEAIMSAERDLSLLPTLVARLQEQADKADAQATQLNQQAAELESKADEARASASTLRRWADLDPLSPTAPALPEWEQKAQERKRLDLEARLVAREAALRAVRAMPNLNDQAAIAAIFASELDARQAARAQALHDGDIASLDEVTRAIRRVQESAAAETFQRLHAPLGLVFPAPIAAVERKNLEAAIAAYRARLGRELPRCHDLATNDTFGIVDGRLYPDRFATAASEAAASALDEVDPERTALDETLEAYKRGSGPLRQDSSGQ